ncbi:hypothetical protein CANCADRAFT_55614 [Tortispora caseinolytica NRRL Y-17796]|uniref:Uncharacterized protein n=1 Tax=Tortispora caseinolytica NRRL Y-17796 TaxID=767744 RepID=A0A1E4TJ96_9ASCO|nr:hypothetical protein CANCADRAFT_55614 [Tortispora caseinolytica NRRL Y-17796]
MTSLVRAEAKAAAGTGDESDANCGTPQPLQIPPLLSPTLPPWTEGEYFDDYSSPESVSPLDSNNETPSLDVSTSIKPTSSLGSNQPKKQKNAHNSSKRTRSYSTSGSESEEDDFQSNSATAHTTPSKHQSPLNNSKDSTINGAAIDPKLQQDRNILLKKTERWIHQGRKLKHAVDTSWSDGRSIHAVLYGFESLLCYMTGFDYEDKSRLIVHKLPSDQSWITLQPFTKYIIGICEKGGFSEISGICFLMRAVIAQRCSLFSHASLLESMLAKSDSLAAGQAKLASWTEQAYRDFNKGYALLSVETLTSHFPNTWNGRSTFKAPEIRLVHRSPRDICGPIVDQPSLRPMNHSYSLPLTSVSTIQEAAAFCYAALSEWSSKNDVGYKWSIDI